MTKAPVGFVFAHMLLNILDRSEIFAQIATGKQDR